MSAHGDPGRLYEFSVDSLLSVEPSILGDKGNEERQRIRRVDDANFFGCLGLRVTRNHE
jgi:hypothetical protein